MIPELRLDHAEGALDVGPLVIVPQELLAVESKVVKHFLPQATRRPAVDTLERNIGGRSMAGDHVSIVDTGVALIRRDFVHVEVGCGGVHKVWQELRITRIFFTDFDGGHDVRFDTTHQMHFHPFVLLTNDAILVIEPADKAGGREARRIDSKIRFDHDGDPANEVYCRLGLAASIPVDSSRGSGVGPRWCSQHRRGQLRLFY
jgi:hypothetical protein